MYERHATTSGGSSPRWRARSVPSRGAPAAMTSSIALLGPFTDVVSLLALAVAVASPRLSRLVRSVIATITFVFAWLITAAFDALRAPTLTIIMGGAVIVVSIVVAIATLHLWMLESESDIGGPGHQVSVWCLASPFGLRHQREHGTDMALRLLLAEATGNVRSG